MWLVSGGLVFVVSLDRFVYCVRLVVWFLVCSVGFIFLLWLVVLY